MDDGLEEFEKALAAEKAERERQQQKEEARRERKHRQHNHRRHERSTERDRDSDGDQGRESRRHRHEKPHGHDLEDDGHRHKRSRHSHHDHGSRHGHHHHHRQHPSRDCTSHDRRRYERDREGHWEDVVLPDKMQVHAIDSDTPPVQRDAWMTDPSALGFDYVHRGSRESKDAPLPSNLEVKRMTHARELNAAYFEEENSGKRSAGVSRAPKQGDYTFGDEGSHWRMATLEAVYKTTEKYGKPVEEVALERYESLREFDEAREEREELERRRIYGEGFVGKERPTGDLYRERRANNPTLADEEIGKESELPAQASEAQAQTPLPPPARLDQTALNRLRAQMMKAKMKRSLDAGKLEAEYNAAMAASIAGSSLVDTTIVLDAQHSRMLAGSSRNEVKAVTTRRGHERGQVEANDDMSVEDMVREERRNRGQAGGEGMRLAERIARDAQFDDDLDYLDENAEKLAKRVHKSEVNLKNMAINEFTKVNRILDTCPLCHHEDKDPPQNLPVAPILALGTRVYLSLPPAPELDGAEGGAVVVPINHYANLLECDDDEWEEIRNFMKSLTRLYHDQGREVLFYENAAAPQRRRHAMLVATPIPWDQGDTAPAFFREAMLSADEEWAQHRKVIDTGKRAREGLGKLAFRRSLAKEMPYFHVWFGIDGGLGHVVEDEGRWPRGDLFVREIIGGMLDSQLHIIKKQGRWTRADPRVEDFKKRWRKFDWTRLLAES